MKPCWPKAVEVVQWNVEYVDQELEAERRSAKGFTDEELEAERRSAEGLPKRSSKTIPRPTRRKRPEKKGTQKMGGDPKVRLVHSP